MLPENAGKPLTSSRSASSAPLDRPGGEMAGGGESEGGGLLAESAMPVSSCRWSARRCPAVKETGRSAIRSTPWSWRRLEKEVASSLRPSGPGHAPPPPEPGPDRPAADHRRTRRVPLADQSATCVREASRPAPPGRPHQAASAGPAAGSIEGGTPTPTATKKDRERSVWPYRDWVIHALNRDMPFDQFTVEQLAGDLLPDATARRWSPPIPRMEHQAARTRRGRSSARSSLFAAQSSTGLRRPGRSGSGLMSRARRPDP